MSSKSVALILGYGPGIGAAVAKKFASKGFKVAVASRSGTVSSEGYLSLKADFTKPGSIPWVFDSVQKEFDAAPSIVVYNAAATTTPPDSESIFSTPVEAVLSDMNVNTISPYVVAQQAVAGWKTLPEGTKKTFIYTGNICNVFVIPTPMFMTGGMGKSASAYWIGLADALYASKGARFFYADERYADGSLKGRAIDTEAHADFYAQLAAHEGQIPWHATFAKDKGYADFKL